MDSSTENLTDLNSIPKPCPYLVRIKIDNPRENADMSNEKG
jgi:hypothetical protein